MTFLVERLAELRAHLDHLRDIAPAVTSREALSRDLSLRNDVLFSLLMVAQLVIDISGELAARRGDRFEDYTEAVRRLGSDGRFPPDLIRSLERLPGFRTSSSAGRRSRDRGRARRTPGACPTILSDRGRDRGVLRRVGAQGLRQPAH